MLRSTALTAFARPDIRATSTYWTSMPGSASKSATPGYTAANCIIIASSSDHFNLFVAVTHLKASCEVMVMQRYFSRCLGKP